MPGAAQDPNPLDLPNPSLCCKSKTLTCGPVAALEEKKGLYGAGRGWISKPACPNFQLLAEQSLLVSAEEVGAQQVQTVSGTSTGQVICIYIYIYVCMCIYIYIYMYICIYREALGSFDPATRQRARPWRPWTRQGAQSAPRRGSSAEASRGSFGGFSKEASGKRVLPSGRV